jgi:hypothetical protein
MDFFQEGGFQQNISSSRCGSPPPRHCPETVLWLQCACRGIPFTRWVVRPDHDKVVLWSGGSWLWEKFLHEYMDLHPLTGCRPALFLAPPEPLPKGHSGGWRRDGGVGWLLIRQASHPRLAKLHCSRSNWRRSTETFWMRPEQ